LEDFFLPLPDCWRIFILGTFKVSFDKNHGTNLFLGYGFKYPLSASFSDKFSSRSNEPADPLLHPAPALVAAEDV